MFFFLPLSLRFHLTTLTALIIWVGEKKEKFIDLGFNAVADVVNLTEACEGENRININESSL